MKHPQPEPLAGGESYGITELGPDHWPLSDVFQRIHTARSWWVCTTRPDGRPHAVPVWGLAIDERVVFSTGNTAVKATNIAANEHVVVHLESGDEVVIVEGTAVTVSVDALPDGYVDAYEAKYGFRPDFADMGAVLFEVVPAKIMAWDEAAFAETAARWRFPA